MSCYIEDEVDYEIFEFTEESCNELTNELNVNLTSRSKGPLGDITPNNNATLKKAESATKESKSRSNATAIAKEHELKTDAKKGEIKNTADKKAGGKKVDVKKNEVAKKGVVKNGVHYYQQQSSNTVASRIYATPHFKGRQQPKETQNAEGAKQKMSAQEELLAKQRRETAESLRRRLAIRQQEGGMKRKHSDGPNNEAKRLHTDAPTNTQKRDHSGISEAKRPVTQANRANPITSTRGFSIRGAAAKASQKERPKEEEIKPKLSVQDRLGNMRKQEDTNPKPPITARLQRREQASPMSKKVENGKSSELVISNLNENTTFNDIKKLVDESNTVAKITYRNGKPTSILLFGSIDPAVTFRRKYNRSKMGDSHINIKFKK